MDKVFFTSACQVFCMGQNEGTIPGLKNSLHDHGFNSCLYTVTLLRNIDCWWKRKWQPTPLFLSGQCHGQRSLMGYSTWDVIELDTTQTAQHTGGIHSRREKTLQPRVLESHTRSSLADFSNHLPSSYERNLQGRNRN